MRKLESFLFFYCIIAITILIISFGIFSPSPLNLISGVALAPIIFYFWIHLTHPENLNPERWSARVLIVIVVLSALGIFGFNVAKITLPQVSDLKTNLASLEAQYAKAAADLGQANAELSLIRGGGSPAPSLAPKATIAPALTISDLISASPSPSTGTGSGRVIGSPGVTEIDVYATPDSTTPKIGTLMPGIYYPYITKQTGWYKIVLSGTTTGWVSTTQVREQ